MSHWIVPTILQGGHVVLEPLQTEHRAGLQAAGQRW